MSTTRKTTKKTPSTKDKLEARGLVRIYADTPIEFKKKLWKANEIHRYTSTTEFKPYFEAVVNALARHKECNEIIARIMSGK